MKGLMRMTWKPVSIERFHGFSGRARVQLGSSSLLSPSKTMQVWKYMPPSWSVLFSTTMGSKTKLSGSSVVRIELIVSSILRPFPCRTWGEMSSHFPR